MTTSSDDLITEGAPPERPGDQAVTSERGRPRPPADPERAAAAADRSVIADLRRQLRVERERSLNATDRVLGAQAEAAQARAEIKELQYRLHVREAELAQANELLSQRPENPGPLGGQAARDMADRAGRALRQVADRARTR